MDRDPSQDSGGSAGRSSRRLHQVALGLLLLIFTVAANLVGTGLVSSNDGSHLALARALERGEIAIDDEVGLTLRVDVAKRDGHWYSDRPPGTAALAVPACWLGSHLDGPIARMSVAKGEVLVYPTSLRFAGTYRARVPNGPNLVGFQGTRLMVVLHCSLVGLAGLFLSLLLMRRWGMGRSAQLFAVAAMAFGSIWGVYSTVLFSHVTAGTLLVIFVLGATCSGKGRGARALWVLAGVCGAWAVAADYALLFVVVPMGLFLVSWRRWAWITAGAAPVIGATMAYHQAAFGSALAIGYDLHANFAFARTLSAMFGSNPLQGAWTLFGAGRGVGLVAGAGQGAGLLVMSPITLVGLVALAWSDKRRWLFVFVPWLVLLCFHQTPWGGATADHRYLIPLFPFIAAGLAWLWERGSGKRQMVLRVALVLILCVSTWLVWAHFYHWRSG